MAKQHFKPEIFLTLPMCALVLAFACAAMISDSWVSGEATNMSINDTDSLIQYNYGLFKGSKTEKIGSSLREPKVLKVVCSGGHCIYSCSDSPEEDIEDMFSENPFNNRNGDICFCSEQAFCDKNDTSATYDSSDYAEEDMMMRKSIWALTIVLVILGLLFTITASVFSVINAFSNPIETIVGVYGLIAWNSIAAILYFLAILLYAIEYGTHLTVSAPISNVIRNGDSIIWDSSGQSDLGFSYWLVFSSIFCHGANIGMVLYYIRKKYRPRKKLVDIGYESGTSPELILY